MSDESVIVRIAANIEELVAGMSEAATVVKEGMESVKLAIEGIGIALVGGEIFEKLIEKTAETGVQLEILSTKTGETVEHLSQLNYAANLSHVSTEELSMGIQRLARNMEEATKSATTPAAEAMRALGITATDSSGHLRPVIEVITDVAQHFSELKDGTGKTALAMDLFGRSGANLIPLLNQGAEGIKKLAEESDRLGNTWSKDDVEAAIKYEDAIKALHAEFTGVERELAVAMFPVLETLANWMHKLIQLAVAVADGWRAIFSALHADWNSMFTYADQAAAALKKAQEDLKPATEAPKSGGTGTAPLTQRDTTTQLERWREEWNKRKEAALGGNADLLFLEIEFWQRKLALAQAGSKDYMEIHAHVVQLETELQKRSTEEQTKELKKLQEEWIKVADSIPKAWNNAVANWKKGSESMLSFWRDVMRQLVVEAAAASAHMIIIHNAEWIEKKKHVIEGHALEVAQSAWSMLKVVADYAVKAAAAAWSAVAGIPYVGPFLAPLAAAATLAGVLALASGGHGGGGGGGGSASASAAATPSAGGGGGGTYNIYAMDAGSFHQYLMKNAPSVAKAAAAGGVAGVRVPGSAGRGSV